MSRMRRVTNMGEHPFYAMNNGRTYIWDPHPSKATGHYVLTSVQALVPIPRNVPIAMRDTVYREMDGVKGDKLVPAPGPNVYMHFVPEEMIAALRRDAKSAIPGRNTTGAVYDEDVIDTLTASLENHSKELTRIDAAKAEGKKQLEELQAQIEAAQERAKSMGILKEREREEGIITPTNRGIK